MTDNVNHPQHYQPRFKSKTVECIDIAGWMPFCLGNAFKYVWRAGEKGDKKKAKEDLQKALWYLKKYDTYGARIYVREKERISHIFDILQDDGSIRFKVLKSISMGYIGTATTFFKALEAEIEEEQDNGNN